MAQYRYNRIKTDYSPKDGGVVFNDPHIIYRLKIQVFFTLNHTLAIKY